MATDFPSIAIRSYRDLITAIVAVKNFRQLSNEQVETIAGLTRSHWDKIRSGTKKAGPMALDALLGALAIELYIKPDPTAAEKVASRWIQRDQRQIRERRVTEAMLERCRPIILRELGRKGAIATNKLLAQRRRQARRRQANGHMNGHARS